MYFKLSIRNAKRSFINYLLYIVTMVALLSVMEVSNCMTITGESAGFQAASFPLLITMIQIVLVGYSNTFMLKQRAKEFANYSLLGMKKKELTNLFLGELLLIGLFCFWPERRLVSFCTDFYVSAYLSISFSFPAFSMQKACSIPFSTFALLK